MTTEVSTDRDDRNTRRTELAAVTFKPNGQMFQPLRPGSSHPHTC